mmetsp:Transcript_22368/g.47757  ORF Transcript_22368/g.47757 Transcript_22368/m.47757 type:complete len:323 (+) Transcript_22368:53-1021(+)
MYRQCYSALCLIFCCFCLWSTPAQALERLLRSSGLREFAIEATGNTVGVEEEASASELPQLTETWHDDWKAVGARARIRRQFAQDLKADAVAVDRFRKSDENLQRLILGQVATRVGHRTTSVASQALTNVATWTLPHLSLLGTISVFFMCFSLVMCLGCLWPSRAEADALVHEAQQVSGLMVLPAFFVVMFILFSLAGAVVLYDTGVLKDCLNESIMYVYIDFAITGVLVVVIFQIISTLNAHTKNLQHDVQAARNFLPDLKHKVDHLLHAVGLESDSEGEEVADMYGRGSKKKMRTKRWFPTLGCGGGSKQLTGKGKGSGL